MQLEQPKVYVKQIEWEYKRFLEENDIAFHSKKFKINKLIWLQLNFKHHF